MSPTRRQTLRTVLVYAAAIACLAWVVHGVRFDEVLRDIGGLNVWWLIAALALDVVSTAAHGVRWRILLKPSAAAGWVRTTQAIYAGLFANEFLPMRAGEVVRGYLVSRWTGVPFVGVLPSMITERLFDGTVLLVGLGLSAFFVPLPQNLVRLGAVAGAVILGATGILLLIINIRAKRKPHASAQEPARSEPARTVGSMLDRIADGLRGVGDIRVLPPALGVSVVFLTMQAVSFWMVMVAYGLDVPVWAGAVVLIIVRLGTAFPNAPANIGPYQFFTVVGLTLFGFDKTTATGFAFVLFAVFTIPLWTIGFLAFMKSGLSLSQVRKQRETLTGKDNQAPKMV